MALRAFGRVLLFCTTCSEAAQLPTFDARALAVDLLRTPQRFLNNLPDDIKAQHLLVCERSLIIRMPSVVESKLFVTDPGASPGPWSLSTLVAKAFQCSGLPAAGAQRDMSTWANSDDPALALFARMWSSWDENRALNQLPLRLLAVVNRLDLARIGGECGPAKACNAEIRFVYGGVRKQTL